MFLGNADTAATLDAESDANVGVVVNDVVAERCNEVSLSVQMFGFISI